ncbi:hypothetical protein LguiA_022031 [Lonicera macranthoides]
MLQKNILIVLVFQVIVIIGVVNGADTKQLNIWPMPESVVYGQGSLFLSSDFKLTTEGSKYADASGILKDGFSRLIDMVKSGHVVESNISKFRSSVLLHGIHVVVFSPNNELQYGIDESYNLSIPVNGEPIYAHLEAQTVYGALHGLQTFSQVCFFDFKSRAIEVRQVPLSITDKPSLLMNEYGAADTSRHYQPLPVIKKVIDSMAYAKLITRREIKSLQSNIYAQRRGISVLSEIDVPGHALSWGTGYHSLWPSTDCKEPLDVSNEFTFKVIDGILSGRPHFLLETCCFGFLNDKNKKQHILDPVYVSDFSKIFKYKFVHLGGDEVDTGCWATTPHVKNWLKKQGLNQTEAYQYFVLRAQKIAMSHGYEVVNWEETFNNFGSKLSRKTVVHNWLGGGVAESVTAAGLRCIVSNQDKWYLDHLDTTWQEFYMNEPLTNITNPKQQKLVIGGEVCMWGEHIDGSDIEQTIWPRAAAAAERLWTAYDKLAKNPKEVTSRLAHFRCLLNQRGVAAAPLAGPGRVAPEEPGSCFAQ